MKRIVFAVPDKCGFDHFVRALEKAGFEVIVCTDADEVLAELKTNPCSGLIIDNSLAPGEAFADHDTGEVVALHLLKEQPALPILLFGPQNQIDDLPTEIIYRCMMDLTPQTVVEHVKTFK